MAGKADVMTTRRKEACLMDPKNNSDVVLFTAVSMLMIFLLIILAVAVSNADA